MIPQAARSRALLINTSSRRGALANDARVREVGHPGHVHDPGDVVHPLIVEIPADALQPQRREHPLVQQVRHATPLTR